MDLPAALDLAKGFGASAPLIGMLLYLFFEERKERRLLQLEVKALLKESLTTNILVTETLKRVALKVGA